MVCGTRRSFRESIKSLEADIHYANTLASRYRREPDGAYFQMRLCFSPAAHLFLFLVQWSDFYLAGALGLLRVLIFMTYADGKTTMIVYEKKASIKQFYAVIFPSLLQLQMGITEVEDRKQRELCSLRYQKNDVDRRDEYTEIDRELEDECGICMEMNSKVVLPDCSHSLCLKCYQDWSARAHSCPFCRDNLNGIKAGDLWVYIDNRDIVELSVTVMENVNRLFIFLDKLPLMDPYPESICYKL